MSTPTPAAEHSIAGVSGNFIGDLVGQLWMVAPVGLAIAAVVFVVPKVIDFMRGMAG